MQIDFYTLCHLFQVGIVNIFFNINIFFVNVSLLLYLYITTGSKLSCAQNRKLEKRVVSCFSILILGTNIAKTSQYSVFFSFCFILKNK